MSSRLGLPICVDDGASAITHFVVVPSYSQKKERELAIDRRSFVFEDEPPGLRIDGFSDAAQDAKRAAVVLLDVGSAIPHQGTDGGGCCVELSDLVSLNAVPVAALVGVRRDALEHEGGCAVGERSVDDVRMSRDPSDVRHAPKDVSRVVVEHVLVSQRRHQQVSSLRVNHTLGFSLSKGANILIIRATPASFVSSFCFLPVLPEVYNKNNGSSESMSSGGQYGLSLACSD